MFVWKKKVYWYCADQVTVSVLPKKQKEKVQIILLKYGQSLDNLFNYLLFQFDF